MFSSLESLVRKIHEVSCLLLPSNVPMLSFAAWAHFAAWRVASGTCWECDIVFCSPFCMRTPVGNVLFLCWELWFCTLGMWQNKRKGEIQKQGLLYTPLCRAGELIPFNRGEIIHQWSPLFWAICFGVTTVIPWKLQIWRLKNVALQFLGQILIKDRYIPAREHRGHLTWYLHFCPPAHSITRSPRSARRSMGSALFTLDGRFVGAMAIWTWRTAGGFGVWGWTVWWWSQQKPRKSWRFCTKTRWWF